MGGGAIHCGVDDDDEPVFPEPAGKGSGELLVEEVDGSSREGSGNHVATVHT